MKRSLEFKIYIGVPHVRDTMPPPLPTPAPQGGDMNHTTMPAASGRDTSLSSGMDKGTGIEATEAARHPGSGYSQ